MASTATAPKTTPVFSPDQLLANWTGNRALTRRVFDAFPEKELFSFSVSGMRTAAVLGQELLAIGAPGMRQIIFGEQEQLNEGIDLKNSKAELLRLWDEATEEIINLWAQLPEDSFSKEVLAFGMYPGTGWSQIAYYIDNEIHHRGQMYVYLRALGIEPPFFWEK
ncbi:MAG: damage-inducible protein DinB [Chitinophagaceae bacterium]|nr:MAG: damage-inducible protein DinB [Chitinophagaceae bacterium]